MLWKHVEMFIHQQQHEIIIIEILEWEQDLCTYLPSQLYYQIVWWLKNLSHSDNISGIISLFYKLIIVFYKMIKTVQIKPSLNYKVS